MQQMNLLLRFPHLAVPRIKEKERSNPTLSSPRCQQDSKNKLEKMLVTQVSAHVFDPTPVSLFPWRTYGGENQEIGAQGKGAGQREGQARHAWWTGT